MKANKLRIITTVGIMLIIVIGFVANLSFGTLSAIGWSDIVLLCPLGALGTMLATKLLIPQAVISLVFAVLFIIVLGRAFCGWICPVPLVSKLRNLFTKGKSKQAIAESTAKTDAASCHSEQSEDSLAQVASAAPCHSERSEESLYLEVSDTATVSHSEQSEESSAAAVACHSEQSEDPSTPPKKGLFGLRPQNDANTAIEPSQNGTPATCGTAEGCSSCAKKREKLDSRHLILGGSLLSAAIFGFPVFCLVCPIGLTFATIFLVIRLFALGDVTWSLLIVPALLIAEVVLFKKWCNKLCPLSAFMSLIGKLNKTFKPKIDDKTCLETAKGKQCGVCAKVCPENIDPRHPQRGESWSECTKCRICVEACPTQSITMPLVPSRKQKELAEDKRA